MGVFRMLVVVVMEGVGVGVPTEEGALPHLTPPLPPSPPSTSRSAPREGE